MSEIKIIILGDNRYKLYDTINNKATDWQGFGFNPSPFRTVRETYNETINMVEWLGTIRYNVATIPEEDIDWNDVWGSLLTYYPEYFI